MAPARTTRDRLNGAAQESNLPSVGLRRSTGFEDQGKCVGTLVFGSVERPTVTLDQLVSASSGKVRAKFRALDAASHLKSRLSRALSSAKFSSSRRSPPSHPVMRRVIRGMELT
jgi:hypothetical protein